MFSNFSNLRKRLEEGLDAVEQLAISQTARSASGEHVRSDSRESSPAPRDSASGPRRTTSTIRTTGKSMTLEERLKAKLAANNASQATPPSPTLSLPEQSILTNSTVVSELTPADAATASGLEPPAEPAARIDPAAIPLPFSPPLLPEGELPPSTPPPPPEDALHAVDSPRNSLSSPPRPTLKASPTESPKPKLGASDSPRPSLDALISSVAAIPETASTSLSVPSPTVVPSIPGDEPEPPDFAIATPPLSDAGIDLDAEKLHERLKVVQQRFSDVSKSFKRIQAEKRAAEKVLKDMTPLEGLSDTEGLREHLRNLQLKSEMSTDEIKRLNFAVKQHDERVEELRDTHRLETKSLLDQIEILKKRNTEAEALITASSATTSSIEAASSAKQSTIDQLKAELEKAKALAKDEEDKRVKAISLLKTVRTKLVQAEKSKEDVIKERDDARLERDASRGESNALRADFERVRNEKDRELSAIRGQYDRELANVRDRLEKENANRKAQFELEAITTKAAHTKELNVRATRISQLEGTIKALTQEKDSMFDQMQLRQAELESAQAALESANIQNSELQYQLREASDRIALLSEESYRPSPSPHLTSHNSQTSLSGFPPSPAPDPPAELARLLSDAEGRFEARLSELRAKIRTMEKERNESEEEWSRNMLERSKEVEKWKKALADKEAEYRVRTAAWEESETRIGALERDLKHLKAEREQLEQNADALRKEAEKITELETSLREDKNEALSRISVLERSIEEFKARESQLRSTNKTLRDELRKVQSSAALLEKQRNPGVGYWAANGSGSRLVRTDSTDATNGVASPASPRSPGLPPTEMTASSSQQGRRSTSSNPGSVNEEEVNLEYLRNVILQFLENDKMRPDLVRVLSVILRFTPQETRRLLAKV